MLKIIVVYKEVEAYEEQGILEDGDSNHRDGADRTDDYAGSERLRSVAQASEEWIVNNNSEEKEEWIVGGSLLFS